MAYSKSVLLQTVFGNERAVHLTVSADAASGNVSAGVGVIVAVQVSPKSCATAAPRVKINSLEAGTAAAGSLGFSGCAAGDDFFVTVFGR